MHCQILTSRLRGARAFVNIEFKSLVDHSRVAPLVTRLQSAIVSKLLPGTISEVMERCLNFAIEFVGYVFLELAGLMQEADGRLNDHSLTCTKTIQGAQVSPLTSSFCENCDR